MDTVSPKKIFIPRASHNIKGKVVAETASRENLWENPPEVTPAMKRAIQQFKQRFNSNQQWDGDFSL